MKKQVVLAFVMVLALSFAAYGAAGSAPAGDEWPDNQFTQLVTKPDFAVASVDVSSYLGSGSCDITFVDVTVDQLKAYAQTLIADGFKYHIEESTDMTGAYTFRAGNVEKGDGFMVILGPDVWSGNMQLQITSTTFE